MSMTADLILKQQERIRQLEADLAAARADGERWRKIEQAEGGLDGHHVGIQRMLVVGDVFHPLPRMVKTGRMTEHETRAQYEDVPIYEWRIRMVTPHRNLLAAIDAARAEGER